MTSAALGKRATGIEPVPKAWKTRARLSVRSRGVQARLYTAETEAGGDPARRDESTQDTPLVTATVTTVPLRDPGSARRVKCASSGVAFTFGSRVIYERYGRTRDESPTERTPSLASPSDGDENTR